MLHSRIAHPWTIAELADEVGISRSALVERFTRYLAEPPITYLTHWRLQLAARALENHVYYAAVNRVGDERGFHFQGHSSIRDCSGACLAASTGDGEEILYAVIDPNEARRKRVVKIPGEYEVDRIGDRRPEMYGLVCEPRGKK